MPRSPRIKLAANRRRLPIVTPAAAIPLSFAGRGCRKSFVINSQQGLVRICAVCAAVLNWFVSVLSVALV